MKNLIVFLFLVIMALSCDSGKETGVTHIYGTFTEYGNKWIFLEELDIRQSIKLDSVKINPDGDFGLKLEISEPGFYVVKSNSDNYIILQLDFKENVKLFSENEMFASGYNVKGSKNSELLRDYELFSYKQKSKVDSLSDIFYSNQGSTDFIDLKESLDSTYMELYNTQRKYVIDFIENNPGSLSSLIVLNRKFGQSKVLDDEDDFSYFSLVDSALMENYPNNKHARDHHRRALEMKARIYDRILAGEKLKPGKTAPNIVLKDTSDNFISLKNLAGKKVLIYFWAGWNAKSRQDNRLLSKRYNDLKSKNIEILGVSLDENEKIWLGAVRLDKLPWINGSDLLGLKSPVKEDYNLTEELPFYYFVDEERKILFRDRDVKKILAQLE